MLSDLGRELYKRVSDLGGHLTKLGTNLRTAVDSYNKSIGTLETSLPFDPNAFNAIQSYGTAGLVQNTWRELPPGSN